jgi:hypothetical protein
MEAYPDDPAQPQQIVSFNFIYIFQKAHNLPHRLDTRILKECELDLIAKRFHCDRLTAIFVLMIGAAMLNAIVPYAAGKRSCD